MMAVTEKVARLWGKLTGYEIVKGHDAWLYEGHRKGKVPPRDYVPDPAEQPWEWVKALPYVSFSQGPQAEVVIAGGDFVTHEMADVLEAALAAAIEKDRKSVV